MHFMTVFAMVIGGLLLLSSIGLAIYVTANGNVLPCCISPFSTTDYAGLILGNVFDSSFAEIWNGEKYTARRAALHTARPLHPCEFCGVNWTL